MPARPVLPSIPPRSSPPVRVTGFFDLYNVLNTNAAQALTTSSGRFWFSLTAITGPRVLRIGGRLDW